MLYVYALHSLHSISYTQPILLEKLFPCCFKSQPKSPTLPLNPVQNLTANIEPLDLNNSIEMQAMPYMQGEKPSSNKKEDSLLHFLLEPKRSPRSKSSDQGTVTHRHQSPPPPSLFPAKEPARLRSHSSSDDEFVMVSPRKKEFET